jgi:ribosomal protein S18 acetylase RimI-like enzyme
MRRDLQGPFHEPAVPAGWTVRHVGGEEEWAERVEAHREVWSPSRVTLPDYRRLRAAPVYQPELDLVAAGPGGVVGSYCICWHDAVNRTGEFEPVGTRPALRRLGLGKAVILEGLRRLRGRGARSAIVYSVWDNQATRALYESAGFRVYDRDYLYVKAL